MGEEGESKYTNKRNESELRRRTSKSRKGRGEKEIGDGRTNEKGWIGYMGKGKKTMRRRRRREMANARFPI